MIMHDLTVADSKQTLASVSKNHFPFNGTFDLGKSNGRLQEKNIIYSDKNDRSDAQNNRQTTDLGTASNVAVTARFYELELTKREEVYLLLP